jgi:hypothetical protein
MPRLMTKVDRVPLKETTAPVHAMPSLASAADALHLVRDLDHDAV